MSRCAVCGRQGRREHHPTGTDEEGRYLDPKMTVPLCHDHHYLLHDDTKTLDIETPTEPLTEVDVAVLRLRRTAATLARIGAGIDPQPIIHMLIGPMTRWADDLDRLSERLDAQYPGWRQVAGSGGDDTNR